MAQAAAIKQSTFTWEGTDKKGKKLKGETRANNPSIVKAELRRQGIAPLKVRKKSALASGAKKKKIVPKDIAIFMRQLSTMMAAGVPLVQSFEIIGRGHENPSMQELILTIKADVESGGTLSDSLAKHPVHFADQAKKEGIPDLRESGLKKVKAGVTSLDEINRVTKD